MASLCFTFASTFVCRTAIDRREGHIIHSLQGGNHMTEAPVSAPGTLVKNMDEPLVAKFKVPGVINYPAFAFNNRHGKLL